MLEWMAWTVPVAVFFIAIVLMLAGMTVWEIRSPTAERRGFLPMKTTRGDRLFVGLLAAAFLNLIFLGFGARLATLFQLDAEPSVWISFGLSIGLLVLIMRKG
jgi:predicted small integral membrane protein